MADEVADVTEAGRKPHPRERQSPPGSPSRWPPWAGYAVAIGLAVLLVVGLAVRADRRDAGGAGRTGPPPAAATGHALGETARTGDLDVTVFGFKDPQPPGQFVRPGAGAHYVSVDVQVANRGSKPQTFSSLLQLHLLDVSNHQFDTTFGEVVPPAPDGAIAPGQAVRGMALFEVPDGTTGLRVRIQGSISDPGVFFALT